MMSSNSSDNNNAVVDEHDNGDELLRKVMAEAMATINNASSTTSVLPNNATHKNSYVDDDDDTAATSTINDDLFKMTVKELQNESKKRAIPYSGLRKVALVETLQSSMNSSTAIGAVAAADTILADAADTDADTDSSSKQLSASTEKDGNHKDDDENQKQKAEIIIIKKKQQQDIAVAATAAAVLDNDDDSHTIDNTACTTSVKANANANAAVIINNAAPAAAIDDDNHNNSIATPSSSSSSNNTSQEELTLTKKQKEVIESQQKELQRHQDTLKGMHNVATNNIHILEEEKKQKKKKETNATATATATANTNAATCTVAVAADINNYHVPKELRSHCSESKSNYWSLQLDQDDDLLLQRSSPSKQPATRTTRKSRRSSLVLPHSTTSTTTSTTTNTTTNTTTTAQLKKKSTEESVAGTSSATIAAATATTTTTTTAVAQLVDDTSEKKDDINSITYNSKDAECKFCGGFYSKGAGLVAHEKRFCRSNPLSWSSYQRFLSSSQATATATTASTKKNNNHTASTSDTSPTTNESTDVDAAEVGINSNGNDNKVECEFCGKFFSEGIGIGVHQTRSFYCSLKNPNKKTNIDETTSDDVDDGSDTITTRDGRPRRLPIDNDVKEKKKRYTLTSLVVPPTSSSTSTSTSTGPYEIGACTKKYFKECRAWYKGEITEYNSTTYLYKVHYDDGDQEELSHHEINTEPFPSKPMYEMNMQFERYLLNKSTEENTMPGTIVTKFYYIPPPQSTINWPRWRYRVEYFDGDSEDLDEFEITASIKSSQHKRGPKKKAGGVLLSSPSKGGRAHDDESNDGKKKPVEDSVGTVTGTSSATIAAATTTTTTIPTTAVKQFVVDTSKEKKDINNTTFSSKYTKCKLCGGFYFKEAAHEPFCRHAIKSAKKALHAMKCAKKALHAIKSAKKAAVAKTTTALYNSVTNNMKMLTQKQKKKESTEEHALAHLSPSSFTPSTSFTSSTGVQIALPQPLTSNPNTESATTDAYAGKFDPSLSSSSTRKKSSLSSPPNMSVNKKTSSSSSLTATSGTPCEPVYKFGTRIKRYFNNQSSWYVGTIRSFEPKTQLYSIEYDHHDDDGSDHHELLELNNDDLHITSRRIGLLPKSNSPLYDIGFQFQKFVQSSPNHSKSAGMIMVGTIKYITISNEINLHRYEWLYRVVYRTKHLGDISFDLSEFDITNSITDQQQQQQLEVNNNNNNNMQRQLKNNTPRMTADGIAVTAVEAAANAVAAAVAFTEQFRKLEHMQRLNKNNAVVDSRPMVATATHIPVPAPVDDVLVPAAEPTPTPVPVSATETTPAPVTALVTAADAATADDATSPTAAVTAAKLATAAIPDVNTDMKIFAAATANDVDPIIKKITFAPTNNGTTTTTASKKTIAVTTKKNKLDAGGQDVNNRRRKIQEYVLHDNSSRPIKNTHDKHELEPQQPRQPIPPDEHDFYYGQQQQDHPYMSLYAPVQMFDASSSASLGGEAGGVEECHDDSDTVMNTNTDMAEIARGSETMSMSNNSDDKDYEEREERFRAILNGEEISIDDIEAEDHGVYHIVGEDGEFETVVEFYDQYHHPQDSSPSPEESASVEEDDGSKSSRPTTPPLPSTIAYAGEAEAGVVDLYHHNYPALLQQQHQFEVENAHYGEGNNNGNDADVMMRSPLTKALLACRNKVAHPTAKLKSTKTKIHKAATTTKMKSSSKSREEKLALIAQQQGKLLSVLQAKKRKGSTNTAGAVHKKKKSKMKKDADAGKLPKNTNQSFAVDVKVASGVGGVSSIDGVANTTPKSKKDKRVKPESKLVEENWYLSYAILVDFYNLNGNSSVLRSDPNKKLSGWVKRQRNNRREGKLCQKKIDELDKLHFVWHRLDHAWDTKYNMLIQYQNKHGNCEIGTNVNRPLAEWTQRQRREYRNRHNFVRQHNIDMTNIQTRNDFDLNKRGSMMTSDRIDALEKIPDWFWEKKEVAKTGVMET